MTVLGYVLAICISLDAVLKTGTKERVAAYAMSIQGPKSSAVELSNRLFGLTLISVRSIIASAVLTIVFTAIMGISILNMGVYRNLFEEISTAGWYGLIILGIAITSTLVADFFSYAKARLLVRAMAEYRSTTITAVVLAADILASLITFSLIFAFGRVAMYVILAMSTPEPIVMSSRIAPTVIAAAADALHIDTKSLAADDTDGRADETTEEAAIDWRTFANPAVLDAARQFGTKEQSSAETIALKWGVADEKWPFIVTDHKVQCYTDVLSDNAKTYQTYDAYANSTMYLLGLSARIKMVSLEKNDVSTNDIDSAVRNAFDEQYKNGPPECRVKLVQVNGTLDIRKMLSKLDFVDLYLPALSITLAQVFDAIPSKFSVYTSPDLSAELPAFFGGIWRTHGLGRTTYDKAAVRLASRLEDIDVKDGRAFLPFSTLIASSLGASILLWSVVLFDGVTRIASRLRTVVNEFIDYPAVKNAIFTFLGLTVVLLGTALYGLAWLVNIAWQTLILIF